MRGSGASARMAHIAERRLRAPLRAFSSRGVQHIEHPALLYHCAARVKLRRDEHPRDERWRGQEKNRESDIRRRHRMVSDISATRWVRASDMALVISASCRFAWCAFVDGVLARA